MENTNFDNHKKELLEKPEFRREYEALQPKYDMVRQLIARRNQRHLSQEQLANLVGTKQPAISRLERGDNNISLDTLRKVANALELDLSISLKARGSIRKSVKQPA